MFRIRRVEEEIALVYPSDKIKSPIHLSIGQEAVSVGVCESLLSTDKVFGTYRGHALYLAKGGNLKKMIAELYGKVTGCAKGKGGSMHMFSREKNFYGGHGIVGAQIPLGTGLAFMHKYNGDGGVCHAYCGDGAINQGQVYESFNMASLWDLPVIYVIENNKYGMGTSVNRASSGSELFKRGESFGIPGEIVDGMNIFNVIKSSHKAGKHVRNGKGPYILEVQTYRYRGHSMSDAQHYRTKDEVAEYQKIDPITKVRSIIIDNKYATEDDIKKIDKRVKDKVKECEQFAEESAFPEKNVMYDVVYEQEDYPFLPHKL